MQSCCKILLHQQQIEAINWQNLQRPATGLMQLTELESLSADAVKNQLEQEPMPQEPRYDKAGSLYTEAFYQALQQRMLAALPTDAVTVRYGVITSPCCLRTVPTMAGSYRWEEVGELDRFAVTLLKLGEPVQIFCTDGSGAWYYVRNAQAWGWVKAVFVAVEPNVDCWRQYCHDRKKVWVVDSRRSLDYVDFDGTLQKQLLLMGTSLPFYDSDAHRFILGIPQRNEKGELVMLQTAAKRDGGLIPGLLPLSVQNIVSQAKKMLSEPYGWGGTGYYRDCTSLITDVFSVFGLQFPRNSQQQLQMFGIEPCTGTREQKYQMISSLPAGSILYFPGHAMLYLGRRSNRLEILHSVYAIGLSDGREVIPHKIKRVVQGDLQQRRASGQLFLEAITAFWVPERQKNFLENRKEPLVSP